MPYGSVVERTFQPRAVAVRHVKGHSRRTLGPLEVDDMADDKAPKLRFNCFLLRNDLNAITDALRAPYRPGGKTEMTSLTAATGAPKGISAYFRARSGKIPPWALALGELFPGLGNALNMSNRFVIFLPAGERVFAVCFGYGSSTLDWSAIEPNFGLRFAARRLSANDLNEIRSRRIDASSRTQSVQIPTATDLSHIAEQGRKYRSLGPRWWQLARHVISIHLRDNILLHGMSGSLDFLGREEIKVPL